MNKYITLALIILLIPNMASAEFLQKKILHNQECTSNTTLEVNQTWLYNNGTAIDVSESQVCANGCNEELNVCRLEPILELSAGFVIVLLVLLIIFKLS